MRKQMKLVAVLSTAALLAMGMSMTSFAAKWEKDDSGIWHYYDSEGGLVTSEWGKDGASWCYLDDDGNMLTSSWVDDESYVNEKGARVVNAWVQTSSADGVDDPGEDGDNWYYFNGKGHKVMSDSEKINGKTYYFDEEGKMQSGWYEQEGNIFYLGDENDGARKNGQWLKLERPSSGDDEDNSAAGALNCTDDSSDPCNDEGWYWFGADGKMTKDANKKKINGHSYYFNEHGQMLYEWINDRKVSGVAPASQANAAPDGNAASPGSAQTEHMIYSNMEEKGWMADGWHEISGSEDTETSDDDRWYFFKDGKMKRADSSKDTRVKDDDGLVYVKRVKVDSEKMGKQYYAFDEYGRNLTGLQYSPNDNGFYYFDEKGYPVSGKAASVECDDDGYEFFFNTKNGKKGQGLSGENSGYLYFNGKKLTADDDNRLYFYNDKLYLVNNKGKIQKGKKNFNIENSSIAEDKVAVDFNSDNSVKSITLGEGKGTSYTAAQLMEMSLNTDQETSSFVGENGKYEDGYVTIPFIQLYDGNVYTYRFTEKTTGGFDAVEMWYDVHEKLNNRWK